MIISSTTFWWPCLFFWECHITCVSLIMETTEKIANLEQWVWDFRKIKPAYKEWHVTGGLESAGPTTIQTSFHSTQVAVLWGLGTCVWYLLVLSTWMDCSALEWSDEMPVYTREPWSWWWPPWGTHCPITDHPGYLLYLTGWPITGLIRSRIQCVISVILTKMYYVHGMYRWLGGGVQYLRCVSDGSATVLLWTTNQCISTQGHDHWFRQCLGNFTKSYLNQYWQIVIEIPYSCFAFVLPPVFMIECKYNVSAEIDIF